MMSLGLIGLTVLAALAVAAGIWLLTSLGLWWIAKAERMENAWLAWVPIAQWYVVGKAVGSFELAGIQVSRSDMVLPLASLIGALCAAIPVLGWIVSLASAILLYFALYRFYLRYRPEQAVLFVVLSVLIRPAQAVILFLLGRRFRTSAQRGAGEK